MLELGRESLTAVFWHTETQIDTEPHLTARGEKEDGIVKGARAALIQHQRGQEYNPVVDKAKRCPDHPGNDRAASELGSSP